MSIVNRFRNPDTIFVFDIDGTLASYEYGVYTHGMPEDEWIEYCESHNDPYKNAKPFPIMQEFIKSRDINKIYISSRALTYEEQLSKANFIIDNYGIKAENMFFCIHNEDKLAALRMIHCRNPLYKPWGIVMVDDSIEVLDYIMENSKYSTCHISSFMV